MSNILFTTSTIADGNMSFRIGDTQHSLENRKQFLLKHGVDFKNHICMRCNHGTKITTVNRSNFCHGAVSKNDMLVSEVLVTQEKELALMLLTADCLPVSLYDPVTETIALAHFSRKTISKMLPQKTISFLQKQFSVDPTNFVVHIGPYIHTESYFFPLPQPDMLPAIAPFVTKTDTHAHIDLVSACNTQLTQAGVTTSNIAISHTNTATSPNHFSHHQNKREETLNGRLATILMLTH